MKKEMAEDSAQKIEGPHRDEPVAPSSSSGPAVSKRVAEDDATAWALHESRCEKEPRGLDKDVVLERQKRDRDNDHDSDDEEEENERPVPLRKSRRLLSKRMAVQQVLNLQFNEEKDGDEFAFDDVFGQEFLLSKVRDNVWRR